MTLTVKWYGNEAKKAAHKGAARGLLLGAEHILEEARRIVPIEEGSLQRDSATGVDERELRAAVSFGLGPASAYAVRQHEELTWRHNPGRQAKYLEEPLNRERSQVAKILAAEIAKELR